MDEALILTFTRLLDFHDSTETTLRTLSQVRANAALPTAARISNQLIDYKLDLN